MAGNKVRINPSEATAFGLSQSILPPFHPFFLIRSRKVPTLTLTAEQVLHLRISGHSIIQIYHFNLDADALILAQFFKWFCVASSKYE